MAGLLTGLDFTDPNTAVAIGLLTGRGNLGANLAAGLLSGQESARANQMRQSQEIKDQLNKLQAAAAQRALSMQQQEDALAPKFFGGQQPDYQGYTQALSGIDPLKALSVQGQLAQLTQKNLQKVSPGETLYDVGANKPVFSAPNKPVMVDAGDAIIPTDPMTGKAVGAPIPKAMSPDAQASNAIARQNLGINQQKLGIEQFNADPMGIFGINKTPATAAPQAAAQGQQVSGDQFLQSLPKPVADQVKALAEGRMQFPGGFALKSPYWQSMLSMVSQYDPSFDAINYNARSKTRNAFTSGQPATQINAMNTVIGHLQTLSDAADALNNKGFTPYNSVTNFVASKFGDPRIQQFEATKKAVVDELTRVWRGNGGSEGDIKTWASAINAANSPSQLHGVIAQIGDLLESKINAMAKQYQQGMGTSSQPLQLITPQARAALNVLEQRAGKRAGDTSGFKVLGTE